MFGFENIKHSDKLINFFTGLVNASVFKWVLNKFKTHVNKFHNRLSLEDHLLIVLMKLKLGLLNKVY